MNRAESQSFCAKATLSLRCYYPNSSFAVYLSVPEGLLPVLILIAVVVIYTIAKVIERVKKSEEQWRAVDKSKLREWDDEDD